MPFANRRAGCEHIFKVPPIHPYVGRAGHRAVAHAYVVRGVIPTEVSLLRYESRIPDLMLA